MNSRNCAGCDEEKGNNQIQSSFLTTKMFFEVTGIEAKKEHTLCKLCSIELKNSYNFRKRVIEIYSLYEDADEKSCKQSDDHVEQVFLSEEPVKQEDEAIFEEESIDDNSINEVNWDDPESSMNFEEESTTKTEPDWSPIRFQCLKCPKSFSKQSALSTHELSHLNLRNFECPRSGCKSAFNVLYRLIRHMRNVHSVEEDEIEAVKEASRKSLPVKLQSKEIQSIRTEEKPRVRCSICMKELSNVKYLKEHMTLQHLDNAPYVCDKKGCGKKFVDHSLFEKHAKKHDGNFEYKCNYCTKGFVQRKTLNQHLRKSHQISQEEIEEIQKLSEKCTECGLIFKTSQKLNEHKSFSHNLGSKYICDFCGKIFFSRVVLISHQKYHQEGDKNKKCSKCPSTFTELKGLKTHMRRVHKMSEVDIFDIFMKH